MYSRERITGKIEGSLHFHYSGLHLSSRSVWLDLNEVRETQSQFFLLSQVTKRHPIGVNEDMDLTIITEDTDGNTLEVLAFPFLTFEFDVVYSDNSISPQFI